MSQLGKALAGERGFGVIHRGWRDALLLLLLGIALGVRAGDVTSPRHSPQGLATVKAEGNRLTVTLRQAPLHAVLRDIARQTGLRIISNSVLSDPLSFAFANLPMEEGFRRLIGHHNFIFHYTPTGELQEVRVYASAPPVESPPSSSSPGAEATPENAQTFQLTLADQEPAQQLAAGLALVGTKEAEKALTIMLDLLAPQNNSEIRERALGALADFENVPVEPIAEVALSAPERSLQLAAVRLLAQQAEFNPIAYQAVHQVAERALDETVREQAQVLLDNLEGSSESPSPTGG